MLGRKGMTLPEIMIALSVFSIAMGGAMGFLSTQQKAFQRGTDDMALAQNLGFGLTALAQDLRTAGSNVPTGMPAVVYAGVNSFAFNSDLTSNVANQQFAVYYDPDAPAGSVSSLSLSNQITVNGSSPARTWPLQNYSSDAETIIYYFELDTETTRTDDYRMMRRVNNATPELVSRNILAPLASAPFFSYTYLLTPTTGRSTLQPVPSGWMPVTFASTGGRSDSLRAVRVNYRVTNGLTGNRQKIQAVNLTVGLPNVGAAVLQPCGDTPVYSGSLTASWDATNVGVALAFPASGDEAGGERDIVRYVVYRRLTSATDWGDPYLSIPTGATSYTYLDQDVAPSTSYTYAVAAQDCTPRLSSQLVSGAVAVPAS